MRKIVTLFAISFMAAGAANAQKEFSPTDSKMDVIKGDVVTITADKAIIISEAKRNEINKAIEELRAAMELLHKRNEDNKMLLDQLDKAEKEINALTKLIETGDSLTTIELRAHAEELNQVIQSLKSTTENLEENNKNLKAEVNKLERINKRLKKETQYIWWDGVTDKIVAFVAGAAVVAVVSLVL